MDLPTSLGEVPIAYKCKKDSRGLGGDDGTKSKYMDRHATWRHKIIRPSVTRPIFDHMKWHTKSKPTKKSQDRKLKTRSKDIEFPCKNAFSLNHFLAGERSS